MLEVQGKAYLKEGKMSLDQIIAGEKLLRKADWYLQNDYESKAIAHAEEVIAFIENISKAPEPPPPAPAESPTPPPEPAPEPAVQVEEPAMEPPSPESNEDALLEEELKRASKWMGEKNFHGALEIYESLLLKRPGWQPAEKGRAEALEEIAAIEKAKREEFLLQEIKPLIAQAKAHYQKGEYDEALKALYKAQQIAPDEAGIAEAIAAIKDAQKNEGIEKKMAEAYEAFGAKRWEDARRIYEEVLKERPNHEEAKKGSAAAYDQLSSEIRFKGKMQVAEDYYKQKRYPKALKAFNAAVAFMPGYMSLSPAQKAMQEELKLQSQPVQVTIESDGQTWVSILGALPPEQFKKKTITLYPDVYEVKGQRTGFRDMNINFPVDAKQKNSVVKVRCTDRL